MNIRETQEYALIKASYGDQCAKRSGVLLINHIDEGLAVLEQIGASPEAMRAYCLHPLFQSDEDLAKNLELAKQLDPYVVMLAMEYRSTANAYLSTRTIHSLDEIHLSPLPEVNQMLVADKIQNFKDFMLHHHGTHPRSDELYRYFKNWFDKLSIPKEVFAALEHKETPPKIPKKPATGLKP